MIISPKFSGVSSKCFLTSNIYQLEATNISSTFDQRAVAYIVNLYKKGAPKMNRTAIKMLKQQNRADIMKTMPGRYSDVTVNTTELIKLVSNILTKYKH